MLSPCSPCKQTHLDPRDSCLRPLLQVGMPTDKAQYIHRVGRTARAGKQVGSRRGLCTSFRGAAALALRLG